MPIKSCTLPNGDTGFQWGDHGHCYATRSGAEAQAAAAHASGFAGDSLRTAAGVLCTAPDGQVLFIKRSAKCDHAGEWALPAGSLKSGEEADDAARREMNEETGYEPGDLEPHSREVSEDGVDFSTFTHQTAGKFKPTLNDEHDEYLWADPSEPPQPLHPAVEKLLNSGAEDADFNESDHPRGASGKFGTGTSNPSRGLLSPGARSQEERQRQKERKGTVNNPNPKMGAAHAKINAASEDPSLKGAEEAAVEESKLLKQGFKISYADSGATRNYSRKVYEKDGKKTAVTKNHLSGEVSVTDYPPSKSQGQSPKMSKAEITKQRDTARGLVAAAMKMGNKEAETKYRKELSGWEDRLSSDEAYDSLAMDKSVRFYDDNGRLRVEQSNISKANVCPYLGKEIPNWEELGLDPKKTYQLLRDPDALEKAADSFNGVPVLDQHAPSTAWDHPEGLVVGTTGTDAVFEAPYLKNSLIIWTQDAIKGIESKEQQELSCSYKYRPLMEAGNYEGVSYDGIMVDILGNHVALVATGRAGPDVLVGDSSLEIKEKVMPKKGPLSRKASLARGALMATLKPLLATDAKIDYSILLKDVTAANWKESKKTIVATIKPKLAADAGIQEIVKLLDSLDDLEDKDGVGDEPPPIDTPPGGDADPCAEIAEMLSGKVDEETLAAVMAKCKAAMAKDAPPEFVGKPEPGVDEDPKEEKIDKKAMDAAIAKATTDTETRTILRLRGIEQAKEEAQPYVGKLALSFDSAEAVYRAALTSLGVEHKDIKEPVALRAVLQAQPKPGEKRQPALAADKRNEGFEERFPSVAAVRVI